MPTDPLTPPPGPDPRSPDGVPGAPPHELARTGASARVGELAARSGLRMAHYEQRVRLETPEHWRPPGRPDLAAAEPAAWRGGMLPEPKYGAFRHDLLIGSFHPGHGAGWTAHELCHGLVGFAWRPGATPLWTALAARLAEVLPVALWYFLDRARAPAAGAGPEEVADAEEASHSWRVRGRLFVEHELNAVARSLRRGRPEPHRLGSLDLSTDSLAYAAAHGPRLRSREFARFAGRFFSGPAQGLHGSLESLAERTRSLLDHLLGEGASTPLLGPPGLWVAQDLAWRLLIVRSETDGDAADALDGLVDRLAEAHHDTAIAQVIAGYEALHEDFHVPDPAALLAVGYPLPGGRYGAGREQLTEGLRTACPLTLQLLGAQAGPLIEAFIDHDAPPSGWARVPLGRRFASFMADQAGGVAADMAALEAALVHARAPDPVAESLGVDHPGDSTIDLRAGVELLRLEHDVLDGTLAALPEARRLAVWRAATGEVEVAELSQDAFDTLALLRASGPLGRDRIGLTRDALDGLSAGGLIVPGRWAGD